MAIEKYWISVLAIAAVVVHEHLQQGGAAAMTDQTSSLSATEYWANALPELALPVVLRERVTALDGSTALVAQLRQSLLASASSRTSDLCAAGHLYCNAQKFNEFRRRASDCIKNIGFRNFPVASTMSASAMSKGDFFRESTLVRGAHMVLGDLRDRTPMAGFLPRKLAEVLNPAASVEFNLQATFGIPAGSLLAKESVRTSKLCQVKTQKERLLEGEEALCALCLEDLADQLRTRFVEGKVELLPVSMPASAANSAAAIAAKVVEVEVRAEATQPYLACHAVTYPFAVHFCHHIPNTRIYSVTLQTLAAGNEQLPEFFQSVAICHLDTSDWDPRHVAFTDLKSSPGRTDACHWTHQHSLVFVPSVAN